HDQWTPASVLADKALQVLADLFLDDAVIGLFFPAGLLQRPAYHFTRFGKEPVFDARCGKSAHHYFGNRLHQPSEFVDGDDGQHDAILAEVAAIANDEVFDHIARRT